MAEERKDSFAETVDTAASAAHTVKGAIKAGKAISGAAKGAAAGGPYGAVAGAVWAGRKHIGKIIAVIAILLLLPVLFLLMLPGLIFGGLVNAFSPADPDTPILNSETAIVENANDITFTINAILGEALDDVIARIEAEIPYAKLNGHRTNRLPGNVNFCFRFIEGESMLMLLDAQGICASSGSACTSGSLDPSHVLLAIGCPHEIAHGSLRLSLSEETTMADADFVVDQLKEIIPRLRSMSPLYADFIAKK